MKYTRPTRYRYDRARMEELLAVAPNESGSTLAEDVHKWQSPNLYDDHGLILDLVAEAWRLGIFDGPELPDLITLPDEGVGGNYMWSWHPASGVRASTLLQPYKHLIDGSTLGVDAVHSLFGRAVSDLNRALDILDVWRRGEPCAVAVGE